MLCINKEYTPQPFTKLWMNQKISDGVKNSMVIMDDSDIEQDGDNLKIRLYYDDNPHEFNLKNLAEAKMIKNFHNTPVSSTYQNFKTIQLDPLSLEPKNTVQNIKKTSRIRKTNRKL